MSVLLEPYIFSSIRMVAGGAAGTVKGRVVPDSEQPEWRPESQPEFSTRPVLVQFQSLEERILILLNGGTLPISIISKQLGQKRVSGQIKVVLNKLLTDSFIEFTIPDKPNSHLLKYRLTNKG